MTRSGYYSPLWVGAAATGLLLWNSPELHARFGRPATYWSAYLGACALGGLLCQMLMIGAQGAFARVLPVPGGKSIRGTTAIIGGGAALAAVFLLAVAGFLYAERSEGLLVAAYAFAIGAAAALVTAGIAYFWGLPAAVADFGGRD